MSGIACLGQLVSHAQKSFVDTEGSRSCSCPDTVWDPVLQLPAPIPGNEAVGHRPRGPSEVRLDLVLKGSDANALEATCSSVGGAPEGGTQTGL